MTDEKKIGVYSLPDYKNMLRDNLTKRVNNSGISSVTGIEATITTLTDILAGVVEKRFYKLNGQKLSDFCKIDVGKGAYATKMLHYAVTYLGNAKAGIINPTAQGINRDTNSTIQVGQLTLQNNFWRGDYTLSNEVIKMAARNPETFSFIEENEKGRKEGYDLMLQEFHFIGMNDGVSYGLLNQPNVTVNTTLMTAELQDMTDAQFQVFIAAAPDAFNSNASYALQFNRLLMPSKAFYSLTRPFGQFGLSRLQVLEDALKRVAGADFRIVHSTYNDTASAAGTDGRYVLYNDDVDNLCAYMPVPYTPMPLYPQNSLDLISNAHAQFVTPYLKRTTSMVYADVQPTPST